MIRYGKRFIQGLRPNALTWLFLGLFLVAQFFLVTHSETWFDGKVTSAKSHVGIGSPVEVQQIPLPRDVTIHWKILAANLLACYFLARLSGAVLQLITPWRHPVRIYGTAILGIISIAFLVSIILSKVYWGYFFTRPELLPELNTVKKVDQFMFVRTESTSSGEYRFVQNTKSPYYRIFINATGEYYILIERIPFALQEKQLLPEKPSTKDLDPLYSTLYQTVLHTGLIVENEPGKDLNGVLVLTRIADGTELVFFGATGGEISNDHFPYYEMVFKKDSQTGQFHFLRGHRFFYDVAGVEGLEWYVAWPLLSIAGIAFGIPIIALIALIQCIRLNNPLKKG